MADLFILQDGLEPRRGRSRKPWLAFLLVFAVVAAGLGWWFTRKADQPAPAPEPAARTPAAGEPVSPAPARPAATPAVTNVVVPPAAVTNPPPARTPVVPAVPPATPADADAIRSLTATLARAKQFIQEGKPVEAREPLLKALEANPGAELRDEIEALLGQVHLQLLFNPWPMEEKVEHVVAGGESLALLAKKYKTNLELIQKGNRIKGSMIRVGEHLRIFTGTFDVDVNKTTNVLVLNCNGKFFKKYRIGTGQFSSTPVGETVITDRIAQPVWHRPDGKVIPFGDKDNELGTHWLALAIRGYGIHGTWAPDSIGKQASAGCIRLLNTDIEELYTLLPVGTRVVIHE